MNIEQITSAVFNNVVSGLKGATANFPFSYEQVEDSIINERINVVKEFAIKGLLPFRDVSDRIGCIKLDCKSIDRCCNSGVSEDNIKHFEIPQLLIDHNLQSNMYAGPADGSESYRIFTNYSWRMNKHKVSKKQRPFVWIDPVVNKNNMYDGFVFNNKYLSEITIVGVLKDPRDLAEFSCCTGESNNPTILDTEIEKRVTEKFLRYYRATAAPLTPNDQTSKP